MVEGVLVPNGVKLKHTVLDPSILFIKKENWNDELKRDYFLAYLQHVLSTIEKYKFTKIYWPDSLMYLLWNFNDIAPWQEIHDYKNSIVPQLYKLFTNNCIDLDYEEEKTCIITPDLTFKSYGNMKVYEAFLKLLANVIKKDKGNFYLCLGLPNRKIIEEQLLISDIKDEVYSPVVITGADQWSKLIDETELYWPTKKFNSNAQMFMLALEIHAIKRDFPIDKLSKIIFHQKFLEKLIRIKTYKKEIIFSIVKRAILSQREACADGGLKDEPVRGTTGERRFRVTGENRIHYSYKENHIVLLHYYCEGEHDDGL
ncbi:hypothetical protein [Priestia megaterium]